MPTVTIDPRFHGPPRSGNGGYVCGLVAGHAVDPVVVSLRVPPPLGRPLELEVAGPTSVRLLDGEVVVAETSPATAAHPDPPASVDVEVAAEASRGYVGFDEHPFPTCWTCGPERDGDGLRIFPGPVGDGVAASLWTPRPEHAEASDLLDPGVARVDAGTTWAALDCVGGWSSDLEGRPMVLGRIAARIDALPVVGETHVVVGANRGSEGRKTFTASTIYDSDGRIVARARHTWIVIDPAAFG